MKAPVNSKLLWLFILSGASLLTLACGGGINSTVVTSMVSATANPLVAQYTITSGCIGQAMVEFGPDTSYGRSTNWVSLLGGYQRTNILVAGMRASTTYHMRSNVQCSSTSETITSGDKTFTTGPLPSSTPFPPITITRPSPSSSSPENPGVELVNIIAPTQNAIQAYFIDRDGNPIWYYDVGQNNYPLLLKPLPNGHMILIVATTTGSLLREVDLEGNTIHEMDATSLDQKTQAAGFDFVPTYFHHDVLPLPNGHIVILTNTVKAFTDLPGYPGTTQVVGDALIDLDENWNPVWSWNAFDYPDVLNINRHLNGLPDWTHSNAIIYSPSDGNLLLSMRHQSWILKIDYSNGSGTGNILWKLGYQGDFALTVNGIPSSDASEWFSAQHYPSLFSQTGSQTTLGVWDNGNFRVLDANGDTCGSPPAPVCYSRAVIFNVDENAKVADLFWDDLPGYFGFWGGNINQLENGNIEFDENALFTTSNLASEVQEVTQTSSPQTVWQMEIPVPYNAYRAYRVPSLYPGVVWNY